MEDVMELTINGQVYRFNFGMGFFRQINKTAQRHYDNGLTEDIGLAMAISYIVDGDMSALVNLLFLANSGENPRLTVQTLDSYIDAPETDVDGLINTVMDFLGGSNACRKVMTPFLKALEEQKNK
jgi:hypothetical protein